MKWISTKYMTAETAPEGSVLVQYLEPSFGYWNVEFAIGYFDNPNDYEDPEDGEGWKHWTTDNDIKVLAYCELPETIKTPLTSISQKDFDVHMFTDYQRLGCVGEEYNF